MTAGPRRTVSRHDLLLAAIPAAFLAVYLLAALVSESRLTAVAAASFAGAVLVADGLFVHPPGDGQPD